MYDFSKFKYLYCLDASHKVSVQIQHVAFLKCNEKNFKIAAIFDIQGAI